MLENYKNKFHCLELHRSFMIFHCLSRFGNLLHQPPTPPLPHDGDGDRDIGGYDGKIKDGDGNDCGGWSYENYRQLILVEMMMMMMGRGNDLTVIIMMLLL